MTALAILALLQVADVLTTHRALGRGLRGANPVMRWLFGRLGFWPVALGKIILVIVIGYAIHADGRADWLLWALVALYAGVVVHNALLIRQRLK